MIQRRSIGTIKSVYGVPHVRKQPGRPLCPLCLMLDQRGRVLLVAHTVESTVLESAGGRPRDAGQMICEMIRESQ